MKFPLLMLDRSAVLLLGVGAGAAIGLSFASPAASTPAVPMPVQRQAEDHPSEAAAALQCTSPAQQQLLHTLKAGAPVRVAVFGDSFGDGVAFGLQQQLTGKAGYSVLKFSQPATGFTRYRQLNLEAKASAQLGAAPVDIAVISFGANDAQGMITDQGHFAALMSPQWQAQIGQRVDRFVAVLRAHHAMVYWVGLPPMRDAALEGQVGAINRFYAERMAALGVPFLDSRPIVSDAKGQYTAYLNDPKTGRQTLIRAGDGVHMSMTGYQWITRPLSGRIETYVAATRRLERAEG